MLSTCRNQLLISLHHTITPTSKAILTTMKTDTVTSPPPRRSLRIKRETIDINTKDITATPSPKPESKPEQPISAIPSPAPKTPDKAALLQARKLKSFTTHSHSSPFPAFAHPSPHECSLAHRILSSLHGARKRPKAVIAPTSVAGCGNSPSVLDALVRTILSQNTSDRNSSRAKRAMDETYGGSDNWASIVEGGTEKLQRTIHSGGLSVVKSRVIMDILHQTKARYGVYSLDHLLDASNDEAMRELLSFQGVGPKTASCVLLFCLRRDSFAVDTHVYRISSLLGWIPPSATREQAQAHLEARVPDEDKYGLHILLVTHGKTCAECKARGKNVGKCALRRAFRKGTAVGVEDLVVMDELKEEEEL
ncbi:DNA glycosylase [Trichoderma novae-zelandiae]